MRPGLVLFLLWSVAAAAAERVYIGALGADYVLVAWGDPLRGGNSIGRESRPLGRAEVRIGDRTVPAADRNWALIDGLQPDTEYPYEVVLDGRRIGGSKVRTWARTADRLCFFVIGDFGNGSNLQYRVAEAMASEWQKRRNGPNPPRFVLTTGDNIYGSVGFSFGLKSTGKDDNDWERRFFVPYAEVIAGIPFYASIGNHDGNESESTADTPAFLDNFFWPENKPARWYRFTYANLATFVALDSTTNTYSDVQQAAYEANGPQMRWLRQNVAAPTPWKLAYFHHPPFTAGPRHTSSLPNMRPFLELLSKHGYQAVFNGHEHNFQLSEQSGNTFNMRFVLSGAGGELRSGDVQSAMQRARVEAFSAQGHFCVVEIEGKTMRITPVSYVAMQIKDRQGAAYPLPIVLTLP